MKIIKTSFLTFLLTIVGSIYSSVQSHNSTHIPIIVDSLIRTESIFAPGVKDTVGIYVKIALVNRDSFLVDYYKYLQDANVKNCYNISTANDCNRYYIEQLQSISQEMISDYIINRKFNRAANLIKLSKQNSMHNCIGGWNKGIDSVLNCLSKLAMYNQSKYSTDEYVKAEFDAWITFCAAGVFKYGEACSPNFDMCAFKADSIEKYLPNTSVSAYSRYRILDLWTHGDGEYGKFQVYSPRNIGSYFLTYPQSKYVDEVKLFICLIPLRGHAIDIAEKKAVCSFLDSCNKYIPSIADTTVLKKLNDYKVVFSKQAIEHGIKLDCK